MAVGRRCSMGCESWPNRAMYAKCPRCGEPTKAMRGLSPLPKAEAESIMRHEQFEDYYNRHCAANRQSVEGAILPAQAA